MIDVPVTLPQAKLQLALWQAEADSVSSSDTYIRITQMGIPSEIAIRLKELMDVVKAIGDKVVNIGKIIMMKVVDFIERHPNFSIGVALGAAFSSLIGAIPFLGAMLAPIALQLGVAAGGIVGHRVDKAGGDQINNSFMPVEIAQDVIEIARSFFQLFIDTFKALASFFQA